MKEKYPFVNFTFNLIFKGKVQAQLQTGTKKVYSHLPENRLKLQTFLDATLLKIKFKKKKIKFFNFMYSSVR